MRHLVVAVAGLSLGLVLAEYVPGVWLIVAAGFVVAVFAWWRRWVVLAVILIMVVVGYGRMMWWTTSTIHRWQAVIDVPTEFRGVVISATSQSAVLTDVHPGQYPGQLSVTGIRAIVGETMTLTCRPEPVSGDWRRAIAKQSWVECSNPTVQSYSGQPTNWRGWLAKWQAELVVKVNQSLQTDAGALGVGLLVGDASYFSDSLRTAFRQTGTTHIVALSGFNVSIILTVLLESLAPWLGRQWSAIVALTLMLGFIIMTGAAASVVRAAVMAVVALSGRFTGRPLHPLRPLLYAIGIMLWQNPGLLLHDLGFQLSAASTAGIVLWNKSIETRLTLIPHWFSIRSNLATTLAATSASFVIIVPTFQRFSLISFAVNVVVLPLVPLAMALSALYAAVLFIVPPAAMLIRPVTEIILLAITHCISLGAQVPGASLMMSPLAVTFFLGIMVSIVTFYVRRTAQA